MGYFHPKDGSDKLFNHMAYCDIVVLNIPVRRSRYSGKVETACPE